MTTIIDGSHIKNRFGAEDIGYHCKEKSKQATKITIITDSTGVPLSLDTCSASCSDVSRLLLSVDNLPRKLDTNQIQTY